MEVVSSVFLVMGLFLSVKTFFYETGHQKANRYLGAFLFCAATIMFFNFHYFYCDSFTVIVISTFGFNQFYFLLGPFALLYIRGTLRDDARLKPLELLHFLPFVLLVVGMIPYFLLPWEKKLEVSRLLYERKWEEFLSMRLNLFLPYVYSDSLRLLSILVYGVAQWVLLFKYRRPVVFNKMGYEQFVLVRRWLIIFVLLYSIMAIQRVVIGGLILFQPMTKVLLEATAIVSLTMAILYVVMNFGIFLFNNLFYGIMIMPEKIQEEKHLAFSISFPVSEPAPEVEQQLIRTRGLFQPGYIEEIEHLLRQWVGDKKYLSRSGLQDLSDETGIPAHHLTYYFNNILKKKFPEWRNAHRVSYAKTLIDEGFMDKLKLEGIAERCGFSSRSTFFRVFKGIAGITPVEYQKSSEEKQ